MADLSTQLDRIVFLNFGGIGDEILFAPTIQAVRYAYPKAHLTLILEARSGRIRELLPEIDTFIEVDLSELSKPALFFRLLKLLRGRLFDAVISSGSSPFIPLLLAASSIPVRVGFFTGKLSERLLSATAPLDKTGYAGEMYFSLARTFLHHQGHDILNLAEAIPQQISDPLLREKLQTLKNPNSQKHILLHPGVSAMSVQKNILKAWPVSHWKLLITDVLTQHSEVSIYLTGGPDDRETLQLLEQFRQTLPEALQSRLINLNQQIHSLRELAALIDIMDVMLCVDSAPMHMAVGLNKAIVAIFTATNEVKLLPRRDNIQVAAKNELTCRPCLWDVRQTSCKQPVCLEVSPALVHQKLNLLIGEGYPVPVESLVVVAQPSDSSISQEAVENAMTNDQEDIEHLDNEALTTDLQNKAISEPRARGFRMKKPKKLKKR